MTGTFYTPPTTDEEDGHCFDLEVDDGRCFRLSTTQHQCFFIESADDGEDLDLGKLGFTTIKCVQAHGLNEIIVVGKWRAVQTDPEVAILAKVIYTPSYYGGIKRIDSLYYHQELTSYGLTDYDLVERLDGWDVNSGLSGICIVYDGNVYYIDNFLFSVQNSTEGHANAQDAVNWPYFDETHYGINGITSGVVVWGINYQDVDGWTDYYWNNGVPPEVTGWNPSRGCEDPDISCGAIGYQNGTSGDTLKTYSHVDGSIVVSDTPETLLYNISNVPNYPESAKLFEGIQSYSMTWIKKRRGDIVFGDVQTHPDLNGKSCYIWMDGSNPQTLNGRVLSQYDWVGFWRHIVGANVAHGIVHNETTFTQLSFISSGIKFAKNEFFIVAVEEGSTTLHYLNLADGTTGEVNNALHATLIKDKLVIADGSPTLTQRKVIEDTPPA